MWTIRAMDPEDLPLVRNLLAQLGYSLDPAALERRFRAVSAAPGHALFVAQQAGTIVGLVHFYARPALDKPPEVVVQALVVDEATRGAGIGRGLMQVAERWAEAQGYGSVALSSNVVRSTAHAFYQRLGYRIEATSQLMRKTLG